MQEQPQNKTKRGPDAEIVENRTKLDTRARVRDGTLKADVVEAVAVGTKTGDSRWAESVYRWHQVGRRRMPIRGRGVTGDRGGRWRASRRAGWGCPTGGCQQRSWHCGQHGQHGGFVAGVLSGFSQGVIRKIFIILCQR
ncbi:unnamed protein product [Sphagnum balticum]